MDSSSPSSVFRGLGTRAGLDPTTKRAVLRGTSGVGGGEVVSLLLNLVALSEGTEGVSPLFRQGFVMLTSQRLIWIDASSPNPTLAVSFELPFAFAMEAETPLFSFASSPRLVVHFSLPPPPPPPFSSPPSKRTLKLHFNSVNDRDLFMNKLDQILKAKPWLPQQQQQAQGPSSSFSSSTHTPHSSSTSLPISTTTTTAATTTDAFDPLKAGVGGILRVATTRSKETDVQLRQAFEDLDGLMLKAKEMVELAHRFAAASSNSSKNSEEENADFRKYALQLGLVDFQQQHTPTSSSSSSSFSELSSVLGFQVTKENAGSLYHSELAREIAGVLVPILQGQGKRKDGGGGGLVGGGGMLLLADVYCIVNRVRGTALISPEDLYKACLLFPTLALPLHMRRFEGSKVLVVQLNTLSDRSFSEGLLHFITHQQNGAPLTPLELSRISSSSVILAKEQLLNAERDGLLCRDESVQGIAFFPNHFLFPSSVCSSSPSVSTAETLSSLSQVDSVLDPFQELK